MRGGRLAAALAGLALAGCVTTTASTDDASNISKVFREAHDALVIKDLTRLHELLAPSTYERYGALKKHALLATFADLERMPAAAAAEVLRVRQLFDAGDLEGMSDQSFFEELIFRTPILRQSNEDLRLSDIEVEGATATATAMRQTRPQFPVTFVRQPDGWKYKYESFLEGAIRMGEDAIAKGQLTRVNLLAALMRGRPPSPSDPLYVPLGQRRSDPGKLSGILGPWRLRDHPDKQISFSDRELRIGDRLLPIRISRPQPGRYHVFTPESEQVFQLRDDDVLVTAGLQSARLIDEAGDVVAVGKLEFVRAR